MSKQRSFTVGVALNRAEQLQQAHAPAPADWEGLVQQLDGYVDYFTVDDHFGAQIAALDASILAHHLAPLARQSGFIAGAYLSAQEPFHVSTAIATLDYVSQGRAGLLLQQASASQWPDLIAARGQLAGFAGANQAEVAADAADALVVIRALWDSWEEGAIIRDAQSQRFLDADKLHYIRFNNERFTVLGPSIVPRPPQGQPVVAGEVAAEADWVLARQQLDVAFVSHASQAAAVLAAQSDVPEGLRVVLDIPINADLQLADSQPALTQQVQQAQALGFDGVRLLPQDIRAAQPQALQQLLQQWRDQTLLAELGSGTLRARLGLPQAVNQFVAQAA